MLHWQPYSLLHRSENLTVYAFRLYLPEDKHLKFYYTSNNNLHHQLVFSINQHETLIINSWLGQIVQKNVPRDHPIFDIRKTININLVKKAWLS